MVLTSRDIAAEFVERYARVRADVHVDIERAVIGGDWGANGYLTRAQADALGERLELTPGRTLLDIGAGRGWPGLYLAASTGCSVIVSDIPVQPLLEAATRAEREGVADRVAVVAASATALPLRPRSVDAVITSDVLC